MKGSFSTAFEGGSSCMERIKSKLLRTFRATKVTDELNSVEAKIEKAYNLLRYLTTIPVNARQLQEHQDANSRQLQEY